MAVPSGYTQLEYIESSGTQYIDTGIAPKNTTRVVADFQCLQSSGDPTVFGAWSGQISNAFVFLALAARSGGHGFFQTQMASYTKDMTVRHTVDADGTAWQLDGEALLSFESATFSCPHSIYLFAYNNNGTAGNLQTSMRIYGCRIYDGGTLMRDFVPALRDSDRVAGLYDTANDVFYTNTGSGIFTYPGYVAPAGAHNTLLDGTAYAITGGKTMVGGTVYGVSNGKTMVDGTVYDISFGKPVTLQNLITDGNFANTTWWSKANGVSYSVSNNIANVYAGMSTSSSWQKLRRDNMTITSRHVYYARVKAKHSALSGYKGAVLELKEGGTSDVVHDSNASVLTVTDWQLLSCAGALNFNKLKIVLCVPIKNSSGAPVALATTQFTETMLIDLTAAFGAGNEPTKEECDEMIDYFSGSTTILWR